MHWEKCIRPTRCRGCCKVMLKGETRLKVTERGLRFNIVKYYCSICASQLRMVSNFKVETPTPVVTLITVDGGGIELEHWKKAPKTLEVVEKKPKRLLRIVVEDEVL